MTTPKRRDRALSETEIALWTHVARSTRPLPGKRAPEPKAPEVAAAKPATTPSKSAAPAKALLPEPKKPALTPLAPLERKLKTQLKRGIQPIEAVIDLHGMRQDAAHAALHRFIWRAQGDGAKLVLVVTGKGAAGQSHTMFGGSDERGVLRRMVPHWLRLPDLRPMVVGFDEADQRHGGSGALYIRLRRLRDGGQ
ncbi:MAG: Smr/MutS family protein [Bosea sp. (in: a-proteobacteria)]